MVEALIVYGVNCVWWDDIEKTGNSGPGRSGIPLCPHCGSVLYQTREPAWWEAVDAHAAKHPGYRALIEWSRGRCFPNHEALKRAYAAKEKDGG